MTSRKVSASKHLDTNMSCVGTILPRELEEILMRTDPPLGLGSLADNKDVLRWV